jgi:phenylpropionate dioxygenase-like ring-hydroxylating dioxygenase large terminal subunit
MVAIGKKYDIIDPDTGKLDRRIFVDQDVYNDEMDKIFGRAWQMVAHTSLVPNPNDFFLSYMGEEPVIVTRDEEHKVHVFLNMCRHRGNRIVRADDGNQSSFMCTYHGWTFDNKGCLNHVPGEQEAFHGELDKGQMGLIEAKADTYAGIIFATWDHEAPSLEAYLGDARWYLDTVFNHNDAGMVALGPQKWIENCNWKTPVDNCSDNYHLPISHWSSTYARHMVQGRPLRTMQQLLQHPNQNKHAFVNGHGLTFLVVEEGENPEQRRVQGAQLVTGAPKDLQEEFIESKREEMERRLGHYRARRLRLNNHSLFPNGVLGFRLAFPRGPYKTEFWHFALVEADAPEEVKRARSIASAANNGPAGLNEQDDMDNWGQVTHASDSVIARRFPAVVSMGVGHAARSEEWPGMISDRYISENNQRGYYNRWMEFMNADSWRDISIEPITVQFEGTAGMHS